MRTSAFVPCPPALYAMLPDFVRVTLFCDWSIYRK